MHINVQHVGILKLGSYWHCLIYLISCVLLTREAAAYGFSEQTAAKLRDEALELFYHGYENYMKHAFPDDEIRPVACTPHTRDRQNSGHFEINDALGNYSLTLIDSLSTLAILASNTNPKERSKSLRLFQEGISEFVVHYGDGSSGPRNRGTRARGFDIDSKVQVFETAIRGLGGLLSAHLFAVGELPILDYTPASEDVAWAQRWQKDGHEQLGHSEGILWQDGFRYDGQLLRLAYDLGQRLIPAFWTPTGIPYPRVNLKTGIPFYANSPHNLNPVQGQCLDEQPQSEETTETCSAGAGSLLLEFTVLSRLTGDQRFEELAKRAFWAVWDRRSSINLIGAGIDAETGDWIGSYTGIGAGIDSFFEYAFKSYVLLQVDSQPQYQNFDASQHPGLFFPPLSDEHHSAEMFHEAWETAHEAIQRHLLRASNYQHPHYVQADMYTGAARAFWIDSLSAYYPGILAISGHVEEAVEAHLLVTALWARFSALPERYNLVTGGVEGGLGWWPGRPEFIESNYYLHQATKDPWYKHVAEMVLQDIRRRCWARCGWTGLQNVLTGERTDRMESFFLGETAKYLFLTFDDNHPLNQLDAPFVFSTEGHPLIIPRSVERQRRKEKASFKPQLSVCPSPPSPLPFSLSRTAARGDVYHAASLARLHQMPRQNQSGSIVSEYAFDHPSLTMTDSWSPSNFTYFPWTLPTELVPFDAKSAPMRNLPTFEISFPNMQGSGTALPVQKTFDGIQVNSLSNIRLTLIQDVPFEQNGVVSTVYRVQSINSFSLGRDEKVYVTRDGGFGTMNPTDPIFTTIRDPQMLDVVIDYKQETQPSTVSRTDAEEVLRFPTQMLEADNSAKIKTAWQAIFSQLANLVQDSPYITISADDKNATLVGPAKTERRSLAAITPAGLGAAPIPDWPEAPGMVQKDQPLKRLLWTTIYSADELCDQKLATHIPRLYQVLVIKRGGCSFSRKLSNIPMFVPSPQSLQLVIVVNYATENEDSGDTNLFRPLLDQAQMSSSGLPRPNPISMVMVGGGDRVYDILQKVDGVGIKRRYTIQSQGTLISNMIVV